MVALCVLPMLAVGFLDAGWASAGSHDMGATTFGLARQSAENPSASDVSPDTVQDKSDADVLAVEDVAEEAALKTASSRDVSAGVQEIADEEEAARLAAEEAARVAEQEAIDRADATRSRYYATFGSLPAGDVDFSIGREAFIEEWSARINDYLFGSPLSGYGETFAEAAWEAGIDPRWSPASLLQVPQRLGLGSDQLARLGHGHPLPRGRSGSGLWFHHQLLLRHALLPPELRQLVSGYAESDAINLIGSVRPDGTNGLVDAADPTGACPRTSKLPLAYRSTLSRFSARLQAPVGSSLTSLGDQVRL